MKSILKIILLVWASAVFGSCSKNIFSNGNLTERYETIAEPFLNIEVNDDVNVTLRRCDNDHAAGTIRIETGENLIDDIFAIVQKDVIKGRKDSITNRLVIHNNNSFNYLRPYDCPVDMTVWYDSIYTIFFNSNGVVRTADPIDGITFFDTIPIDSITRIDSIICKYVLEVQVLGGSGELHLLLNDPLLYTDYMGGTSSIYAKGYSKFAQTQAKYECHGIINYKELVTRNHHVYNHGTNKIFVNVFSGLKAANYNNGEIYYLRYDTTTYDYIPPLPTHQWGTWDSITHHCPEFLELHGGGIYPLN